MIALGFWQLGRMEEKDALIQRAERSLEMAEPVGYPRDPALAEELLYRRTEVTCAEVVGINTVAGTSLRGEKGVAHRATCALPSGEQVRIDLGFSRNPAPVEWVGGRLAAPLRRAAGSSPRKAWPVLPRWRRPIHAICPTTTLPMRASGSFSRSPR
ncbi:SURF1 family cytochrome oxidase biogenesis protein [Qipengyuania sp. GPGPB31]|uniref:SURF1 family cytochrome oxidase biogenesis protein n=1 Tax=Qipengyuania sp. GPGPB31 TaxID=3023518 RepID=UPI00313432D4